MNPVSLILLLIHQVCATVEQIVFKKAADRLGGHALKNPRDLFLFILKAVQMPLIWAGFLLVVGAWVFWFAVLSYLDLNVAVLVDSMQYIMILLASYFLLKEKIGWLRILGTAFILGGVLLVVKG
ncbi:MAG: EamA family transporter [Candidatus Omnitrophica bacterium]|nr:EamA family transporter [Candidatus Omnitrophota bacterium]